MARINISIPDILHRQMQEVPEWEKVNWSAVAAGAFRSVITGDGGELERLRLLAENERLRQILREVRRAVSTQETEPSHS